MKPSTPSHADLIDKLQKLRVLAYNKAAMPGEVDAALRAMTALMARYRITEAELESSASALDIIESEDLWPAAKHVPNWRIVLLNAIGRPNGLLVHAYCYPDGRRGIRFAGKRSDVEIGKSLWSWLEAEAIRLVWGPLAVFPLDTRPKRSKRLNAKQRQWIIGFAFGIGEQLRKEVASQETPGAHGISRAMVVIDQRELAARNWLVLRDAQGAYAPPPKEIHEEALLSGFEAGERYHLGKKLPQGESP